MAAQVTKVIRRIVSAGATLLLCLASLAQAQSSPAASPPRAPATQTKPQPSPDSAEALYLRLQSVGLDKQRVYHIREASLDRGAIHISLDDGKIAFTQDVAGRVTGAFFEGDGEILLMPPNEVERASMALFTGAAILEEQFTTAYFRFNDDTFAQLQASMQPVSDSAGFVDEWNDTARDLAPSDALRLLLSFSKLLPVAGVKPVVPPAFPDDRMLHARMQGANLGTFDVHFDSRGAEQVWAGAPRIVENKEYYNIWTSFALPAAKESAGVSGTAEELSPNQVLISAYKIKAQVTPPAELAADTRLQMEVLQGGERAVLFELSRYLQIDSVTADGHPLEFIHNPAIEGTQLARRGNDLLAVVFPQPLTAGERIELHFTYHGDVLSEAGGGLMYVGARGVWYPNRGLEVANFDMEFHYPATWTLVATGRREDLPRPANPAGELVSRWVSERPIPFAGFNLGKYSHATADAGTVKVETYAASAVERNFPRISQRPALPPLLPNPPVFVPPIAEVPPPAPSPARAAPSVSELAARAITAYSRWYGPFPYSHLSLTQMPGEVSQGWPELIFLSSYVFLTPQELADLHMHPLDRLLSRNVVAHETAHQWWGDLVTWDSYRDQWALEGLSEYSSLMLLDEQEPVQFRAVLQRYRDALLEKNKVGRPTMDAGPVTLGTRLSSSEFPSGYETIAYQRGTWLFHMLHTMLLDGVRRPGTSGPPPAAAGDPFLRDLRRLREQYQGKPVTTREILQAFEESLPPSLRYEGRKSLDWFYNGWINGTAIPRLDLQNVKYSDRPGATIVSGTILQKDAPADLVTCVPIYATIGNRDIYLGRVFADGQSSDFRLTAPLHTRKVVLDPDETLLTRNH